VEIFFADCVGLKKVASGLLKVDWANRIGPTDDVSAVFFCFLHLLFYEFTEIYTIST
jgi:hypothetical protein